MITLNEIAYNIKNLAYGGKNSTENNISTNQIKHWIHYHRAKLIADNIDKGITNNQALYQSMSITARNSTNIDIQNYYNEWDVYNTQGGTAPTTSNKFLLDSPKEDGSDELNGEWILMSSLTTINGNNVYDQAFTDKESQSFYGNHALSSGQLYGSYRNFGFHSFSIPKPLQLKNDEGIKNVDLERIIWQPEMTGQKHYQKKSIKLYRKEYNNFDDYNKFTDNTKPYYTQETSNQNKNNTSFRGLQVVPNYWNNRGGTDTLRADQHVLWKYRAYTNAILENPTEINTMWDYDGKIDWDDSKNPYPIPMEYVSDLIQRVVQVEMQIALKTTPDIITDGLDDGLRMKASGTQVQR